uniref:Uncharacterized protein n=1 Tax=Anguilla anguilla TaxID=7936 RepID=A0A0E9TYU9_ANGAN
MLDVWCPHTFGHVVYKLSLAGLLA